MPDALAEFTAWAARAGPPNLVFVLALLTRPAQWTQRALGVLDQYLGTKEKQ